MLTNGTTQKYHLKGFRPQTLQKGQLFFRLH